MPLLERPPLGRITAIVVSKELRGRGIGRLLVERLVERARRAGYERLDANRRRAALVNLLNACGTATRGVRTFSRLLPWSG